MSRFFLYLIASVLTSLFSYGQKAVYGIVKVEEASAEGIHVTNLVSEKSTVTNEKGEFWLEVKEDDLLVFSAVHLNYWRKSISEDDIKSGKIDVVMTAKVSELEEVVVTEYPKINAQDLGIIDYKPKVYTPAERRLRTAEKFKWYSPLLIPLGGMSVDGLINQISGRTNQLKKEVQIEVKEKRLEKLMYLYKEEYFNQTLKVPSEYVGGFQYYVIHDEEAMGYMKAGQKTALEFRMAALATEFLNFLETNE